MRGRRETPICPMRQSAFGVGGTHPALPRGILLDGVGWNDESRCRCSPSTRKTSLTASQPSRWARGARQTVPFVERFIRGDT